jgi:hypothetical protein
VGVPACQVERPTDDVDEQAPNGVPWITLSKAFDLIREAAVPEFMLTYQNIPGLATLLLGTLPSAVILEVRHTT